MAMTLTNKKNCQSCGSVVGLTMMYCPSCGSASFNSGAQQSPVAPTDSIKQTSSHPQQSQSLNPTLSVNQTPINQASNAALHPWRRYFARTFDIIVYVFLIAFAVGYAFPEQAIYLSDKHFDLFLNFAYMIFIIPIEAFCLYAFGSTIGKALYGIHVERIGQVVSFGAAFHRTFYIWFFGLALGIPLVGLVSTLVAYFRLKKTGTTSWDANLGWTVSHTRLGGVRWIAILLSWAAVLIVLGVTSQMAPP